MTSPLRSSWRGLRVLLSLTFTLAILALLLWRVRPAELGAALGQLSPAVLALGLAAALLLNLLQAGELLRRALGVFGQDLSYRRALVASVRTLTPKMALPGGLGLVVRILYLHRAAGLDLAGVTMSLALIPWFKLAWMLAMPLAGYVLGAPVPPLALWITSASLAGMLVLSWAAPRGGLLLLEQVVARWGKLRRLRQTLSALGQQARWRQVVITAMHALLSAALEVLLFYVILVGVMGPVDPVTVLAIFPLCALGSKVPVAFLGLGAREALVLLLLSSLGSPAQLLAAALAYSALGFMLPPLLTAPFTWRPGDSSRVQL